MSHWDNMQAPAGYGPQYKSRPEREIADCLTHHGIPFIYEKPIAVIDDGKTKIWYVDFALRGGTLIEYFGIRGDRGYMDRARHKLSVYHAKQYDVIPVYPADMGAGWQESLIDRIGYTLENRLRMLRGSA